MIAAWYGRLNKRERLLSAIVAGVVFILLNVFMWSWLFGGLGRARAELAEQKSTRAQQSVYMKERDLWVKRDEWIQQHQPTLSGPGEASKLLEEQIKPIAAKYNVLIENPQIGSAETTPYHQTVFSSLETKSPWPALVHFLYDVQQPEKFIVFETVTLSIDGSDPTMMRGKFKITRWFAPAQRKKG
ncbi:MAG: hypothetical protein ABI925_12470 [Verrucomicrobiota bacterium]